MAESYVGVMSGTSLDGIDLVLASIDGTLSSPQVTLEAFEYQPFSAEHREILWDLLAAPSLPPGEILSMHNALGDLFGRAICSFLDKNNARESVVAIGLHGLTFHHQPKPCSTMGRPARGSWQLGDPTVVRQLTGIPVVHDFRSADMAAGGQGAPLVPFLDRLLFGHESATRILLNLGGIANLTFLRPNRPMVAFDTGPANMLIDALMRRHPTHPGEFDPEGSRAAAGKVIHNVLNACMSHPFFAMEPPKSTGREIFGESFLQHFYGEPDDQIATATELTVRTVADAVLKELDRAPLADDALICAGGGSHNKTLMDGLQQALAPMKVQTTADFGLNVDAKEGLLMAVLAWARLKGVPANLPEVTGAERPVVLGSLTA